MKKLAEVLGHAQEYLDRAVRANGKDEREFYKRIRGPLSKYCSRT
jgi:hypothetical protein